MSHLKYCKHYSGSALRFVGGKEEPRRTGERSVDSEKKAGRKYCKLDSFLDFDFNILVAIVALKLAQVTMIVKSDCGGASIGDILIHD